MSEWAGDSATLVISLGEADRAVYNPYDSKTHNKLEYKIVLTGKIETLTFSVNGGTSFEAHVAPGDWNVRIVSYIDGDVYSAGEKNVTLKLGVNYESIDMYEAHLVKFDSNGGSAVPDQVVLHNNLAIKPPDPSYPYSSSYPLGGVSYYNFLDWYTDSSLEKPFYFEDTITKSITLYAKWDGEFNIGMHGEYLDTLEEKLNWLRDNAVQGGDYTIYTNDEEEFSNPYTITCNGKTVSITLIGSDGTTISSNTPGSLFTVEAGVTLKLDYNIILDGCKGVDENVSYQPLVVVNTGGTLVMRERSAITHITPINNDNGVVINGGTFIMNGGEICNNNAEIGGGVYVKSGTFTMNDGVIRNNSANYGGGGVYVENGTFTMYGGVIGDEGDGDGNSANYGGGVYVENGTFTMYGGKISRNSIVGESSSCGGGVYVADKGTFILEDGEIFNNTCTNDGSYGGGIYAAGIFIMKGGKIYGNTINYGSGGGVYVAGTFTMEKGEIFGNYDDYLYYGGGVFVDDTGIFNMKGGNIYGNFACYYGGGVYVLTLGTFTKSGGTIYGDYGNSDPKSNYYSAVYVFISEMPMFNLLRNNTVGPNDSLSYNGTTGKTSGYWDNPSVP